MRRLLPVAALLIALTSCSSEDPGDTSGDEVNGPAGGTALAVGARPKCADVFVPGKTIVFPPAESAQGCVNPDGGLEIVGSRRCADGRYLFNVGAATGVPAGWGRDGELYHAVTGELGSDPDFSKAYDACG
jgi:hypothetical protein